MKRKRYCNSHNISVCPAKELYRGLVHLNISKSKKEKYALPDHQTEFDAINE